MAVICCYLERRNYKVLKFYVIDPLALNTFLFNTSQSNKLRTSKLQIATGGDNRNTVCCDILNKVLNFECIIKNEYILTKNIFNLTLKD